MNTEWIDKKLKRDAVYRKASVEVYRIASAAAKKGEHATVIRVIDIFAEKAGLTQELALLYITSVIAQRDYGKARVYLDKYTAIYPRSQNLRFMRAVILKLLGDRRAYKNELEQIQKLGFRDRYSQLAVVSLYLEERRYDDAFSTLETLRKVRKEPFTEALLVNIHLGTKRLDEAEYVALTSLKTYPQSPFSWLAFSKVLWARGNHTEAIQYMEKVCEAMPPSAPLKKQLANMYLRAFQWAKVFKLLTSGWQNGSRSISNPQQFGFGRSVPLSPLFRTSGNRRV